MNTTVWEREIGPLEYPLCSDFWPHGEVSRSYGVFRDRSPLAGTSERAIFVIDRAGRDRVQQGLRTRRSSAILRNTRGAAKNVTMPRLDRHAHCSSHVPSSSRSIMKFFPASGLACALFMFHLSGAATPDGSKSDGTLFGFRDASQELKAETRFLAVPDPKLAEEHLRILTQAPHIAGSPEDKATADYVASKFREAGLDTEIVEYRVWFNYPTEISVDATAPAGVTMHGPTREHVDGDPFQDDPRVVPPYNGMSPSGDVEAEVVYANYGSPEDFQKLAQMKIDVRGKIVLVRYGQNFRGVKVFVAQEHGAAGVHHLFRSRRRRMEAWRQISARSMASRHRRAARLSRLHVSIPGRSDHAGRGFGAEPAGVQTHSA